MGVCVTAIVALPMIPGFAAEDSVGAPTAVFASGLATWIPVLGWIWLAGILWHGARFGLGTFAISRIGREGTKMTEEDGVQVLVSENVEVPFATGLFRKRVLLPKAALDWPKSRLEQVLAHEFHHHRAGDLWLQNLSHLICAVFWWNPLVWRLAAEWQREREFAADRAVLEVASPKSYAQNLLEFSQQPRPANRILAAALYITRRGKLETRIERLLSGNEPDSPWRQMAAGVILGVLLLAMPLCVAWIPIELAGPASPELKREAELRLTADPFPGN